MSAARRTPGPWKGDRLDGTVKYSITGPNGDLVLAVQHKSGEYGFIGPNGDGDELLALAAPDLLRALQHAVGFMEFLEAEGWLNATGLATLNGARRAIAKATGE